MKQNLKDKLGAFKRFFIQWNEFITVPIAFLLFWIGGFFIRWVDPTAGLFDAGIFQIIFFAVAAFLFIHGVAWFVLKITFPKAFKYIDYIFEEEIDLKNINGLQLTTYQRCVLILLYFSVCLFSMVLLARVIM